jgi:transcriptional regulator with XRE-family HTH domain
MQRHISRTAGVTPGRQKRVWAYRADDVGFRLRRLRVAMGKRRHPPRTYTQDEMAAQLGITQQGYATFESRGSKPNGTALAAIKENWDVTSDWILFGDIDGLPGILISELESVTDDEIAATMRSRKSD